MAERQSHQPIHPSMEGRLDKAFIKLHNDNIAYEPLGPMDLTSLRNSYSSLYNYCMGAAPEAARTYDTSFTLKDGQEIALRVYEPASKGHWPVHVNFHGGGWILGDLNTAAHICKHICTLANVVVIDVAYRLAPEHPYPTAILDSFEALQYIYKHGAEKFQINPDSISVGGTSVGGSIALMLGHLARDSGISLRILTAGAPLIDEMPNTLAASPYESMRENEHAPTLNWALLKYFNSLKFATGPEPRKVVPEGWFANLLSAPNFHNLSRTVIYTASADPLRDEAEAYGQKLAQNGNEVVIKRFLGVPHPFMHMDGHLKQGKEFIEETARHIRLAHYDELPN